MPAKSHYWRVMIRRRVSAYGNRFRRHPQQKRVTRHAEAHQAHVLLGRIGHGDHLLEQPNPNELGSSLRKEPTLRDRNLRPFN